MTKSERIKGLYNALYKRYGSQGWWPAETELECILGAILTQNTAWKNVEIALSNLKKEGLISIEKLALIPAPSLAEFIRPSGYFNQKAVKIKNFIHFLIQNYNGSLQKMFEEDAKTLREKLLSIKGIGPETADSILLYAGKKPIFVVDAYTYRVLSRHGLLPDETTYQEIQELLTESLPEDTQLFNEYHALLVKLGKEHCRKNPVCEGCPLEFDPHTV
ncbi:MAG TPA: endonuclease III domain-containing protein [Thermodesulfobacteriota bacterium]|nr:endonuclease III domain-containing protein [Thermodesulfobacteriota bacterium]